MRLFINKKDVITTSFNLKIGGGEIRTHGSLATTTVFKTVPLNHSGTPPKMNTLCLEVICSR